MESLEILERLAANPHITMTPQQIERMRALQYQKIVADRAKTYQHDPLPPQHPTGFTTHPTEPPRQDDHEAV